MLHHHRYNLMRKRTKAIHKAIADMLDNWDNTEAFNSIYQSTLTAVKWAAPVKQCTLNLRTPGTAPASAQPHQLKLFL